MKIEINELAALLNCKPQPSEPTQQPLGNQIIVMDRGFVYVGSVKIEGDMCRIGKARNIRKWGTVKGLGELVNGPTSKTILDDCGEVLVPMRSVIHFIKCSW